MSSRTNLQVLVLVLVLGSQVIVLVLEPFSLCPWTFDNITGLVTLEMCTELK